METKRCPDCKITKDKSDFNKNSVRVDGLQSVCRSCGNQRGQNYFENNAEKQKTRIKARVDKHKMWIWDYLAAHPCIDCGEVDPLVLEFDHVRGIKKHGVMRMVHAGQALKTIQEEIEKCEVRCANCHRRKTAKQFDTYKYLLE